MSEAWGAEAQRVDAWARPAQSAGFKPWSGSNHPRRRASDFSPSAAPQSDDDGELDIETLRAQAFAEGFERGRESVGTDLAAERAALADLIRSAEALRPEPSGPLATILTETVTRLVKQIVGEVTIDTAMLKSRAESIAELVTAEAGPARLRMHPDDAARLEGHDFGVPVMPDHHLSHGTIMLETGEGWIEDGPQVRLARLRAQLDAMGMPR